MAAVNRRRDRPSRGGAHGVVRRGRAALRCVHCPDMAANPRARRIDVRVSEQQDAMIREAAALAGKTVTGFLLDAAEESAREVFDERRDLVMSKAAFARFAEALDAPAEVVPEMVEMFRLPRIPEA